ncbi:MAG: hypothetical protein KJ755_05760 [Alphaproteobacteria bacterium]|nr:hypothetical protein [Alphaproteobacteria bacterium]
MTEPVREIAVVRVDLTALAWRTQGEVRGKQLEKPLPAFQLWLGDQIIGMSTSAEQALEQAEAFGKRLGLPVADAIWETSSPEQRGEG